MSFTNMFTLGPSPLGITYAATNTYRVSDMMTWIKGKHTMKFGGEYKRQELDAPYFDVFPNGEMFYLGTSGHPVKDFLSGLSGLSAIGSGTNSLHNRANDFSAFFQDDWKVTPRLTVNLGMRYDYFGPTTETHGHFVGFDPSKAVTTPLLIPEFLPRLPSCTEHLRLGRHRWLRPGREWKLARISQSRQRFGESQLQELRAESGLRLPNDG